MGRYDDLLRTSGGLLGRLQRVDPTSIAALLEWLPGIPREYVDFLAEIGWGEIGNASYMIYERVIPADEVIPGLEEVLLFGDDFAGYLAGFDTRANWVIVEVDSAGDRDIVSETFDVFIRHKVDQMP